MVKRSSSKKNSYPQPSIAEVSASIWKRIGAYLIDVLIVSLIVFLSAGDKLIPDASEAAFVAETYAAIADSSWSSFLFSALTLVYYVLLERKFGQSVGKMVVNIYVVPSIPSVRDVSGFRHIGRCMFLIPIFGIADSIAALFTKDNQRLSEMLTKTKVIERKQIVPMDDVVV